MKKMVAILICGALVFSIAGCGTSETEDKTEESADKETEEPADDTAAKETEEPATESTEKETKASTDEPESINLGEQVEVTTEYGDFLLTVDAVRKSDWVERHGDDANSFVAVLVECDIDNTGFEDPYNSIFWLENYLSVTDDDGYVVDTLSYGYDDGQYSSSLQIPVGSKGRVVVAYNCGINVQNLTININDQYVLETQIDGESDAETATDEAASEEADEEVKEISKDKETDTSGDTEETETSERFVAQGTVSLSNFLTTAYDNGYSIESPSRNGNTVTAKAVGPDKTYSMQYTVQDQHIYNFNVFANDENELNSDGFIDCVIGLAKALNSNLEDDVIRNSVEEAFANPDTQIIHDDTLYFYRSSKNEISVSH